MNAGAAPGSGAPDSVRWLLRSATADYHAQVDAVFSTADLTDRDSYGRFLSAQAAAHIATEDALTRGGAAAILPDWPARQRAELIRDDLAALGLSPPPMDADIAFPSPPAILGGVYVLEGSRLGGGLLRRSVPPHLPHSFLDAGDPGGWRRLMALLDERLKNADDRSIAVKAATEVFVLFAAAGHRFLKAT